MRPFSYNICFESTLISTESGISIVLVKLKSIGSFPICFSFFGTTNDFLGVIFNSNVCVLVTIQ